MNAANRNRALWLLVALVSIHALVTTAVYLATGTLPSALLAFTLGVYGLCALAALGFLASAPRRVRRVRPQDASPTSSAARPAPLVHLQVESEAPRGSDEPSRR